MSLSLNQVLSGKIVTLKVHKPNNAFQHRTFGAGQLLSRVFVVLLRKSIPQNRNLKAAAELNVSHLCQK